MKVTCDLLVRESSRANELGGSGTTRSTGSTGSIGSTESFPEVRTIIKTVKMTINTKAMIAVILVRLLVQSKKDFFLTISCFSKSM